MTAKVFIDGQAGTTGLQIRDRLVSRRDITVLWLADHERKEAAARKALLNQADAVILCLPDEGAREAVGMIDNLDVKIIDASTAHRVSPGWTYGLPEMTREQRAAIAASRRVTNPGCYPTGFLILVRPLVDAGLVPRNWPVSVNAVSGYSGGGRAMIARFEGNDRATRTADAFRAYGLDLQHKHVPEMQLYAGLDHPPIFAPSVGRWRQGMIVEVPLPLWALPARPRLTDVRACLADAYSGEPFLQVVSRTETAQLPDLEPESLNGSNRMKLIVAGCEASGQARLLAVLDNLGKGASGAAVQSLNLMLGLAEASGLE